MFPMRIYKKKKRKQNWKTKQSVIIGSKALKNMKKPFFEIYDFKFFSQFFSTKNDNNFIKYEVRHVTLMIEDDNF